MQYLGKFSGFVTKATEKVFCYLVENASFNSQQNLDETEDIEVVTLSYAQVEQLIEENKINAAITVATWDLAKRKFKDHFEKWQ